MATKEWLNSHAKVAAYLDFGLYASLENWMKKNKIKKVSGAAYYYPWALPRREHSHRGTARDTWTRSERT